MAAVNFYKFAAAVMELLEPEKYNFTRDIAQVKLQPEPAAPEEAKSSEIASDSTLQLATQAMISATKNDEVKPPSFKAESVIAQTTPSVEKTETAATPTSVNVQAQQETKTIAAVTEQLTLAIGNASGEKLAQVAQAIKEASVETVVSASAPAASSTAILQTDGKTLPATSADAEKLVKDTVNMLAVQTAKEIKQGSGSTEIAASSILTNTNTVSNTSEQISGKLEQIVTEAVTEKVTTAITNKLKEKVVEQVDEKTKIVMPDAKTTLAPIQSTTSALNNVDSAKIENQVEEKQAPTDFWELFPELDITDDPFYGVISDLYSFMSYGTLMDILNPANDLNERYILMNSAMRGTGEKVGREADTRQQFQQSRYESDDKQREANKETRESAKSRQIELERWQQQARAKLDARRAAERMKEIMK